MLRRITDFNILSRNLIVRSTSAQPKIVENENEKILDFNSEWASAQPFKKIPGPSKLSVLRAFLPGGKYYKKQTNEVMKMGKNEYGKLILFPSLFGSPEMLISFDPNDYQKIFRTEGKWPQRIVAESIKNFRLVEKLDFFRKTAGLTTDQGERWGYTRSVVNPVLMQPRTVTQYIPSIDSVSDDLIERMRKLRDTKTNELPSDFDTQLHYWALESMGVIALDTRLGLLNDFEQHPDAQKLINDMQKFFHLIYELEIKPNLSKYISTPNYKEMMNVQTEIQEISIKYIDKALDRLQGDYNRSKHDKSVLERLIDIDIEVALVTVTDMLMFGVDTTTSAFISCLYLIAKNPAKQKKLFEELKNILPTKDAPLTKENMKNLPYLRACIKEALRIHPAVGGSSRRTGTDLVLSGYQVPEDTLIFMPGEVIYGEEEHFPEPKKFIPERWLKDQDKNTECPSAKTAHSFAYLPFGYGARSCVGKRLAQMELEIGLAKIFRNYHVKYNYPDLVYESHAINVPKGSFKFQICDVSE